MIPRLGPAQGRSVLRLPIPSELKYNIPMTPMHLWTSSLALAIALSASTSFAQVDWQPGPPAAPLTFSPDAERDTLLYFTADWCPSCQQLEEALLSKQSGAKATSELRAIKVDVDAEGGASLVKRFVVLSYPSALLVNNQGKELGRVVGFEDAKTWTQSLSDIASGKKSLAELAEQARRRPSSAPHQLDYARALLERGKTQAAFRGLDLIMLRWPASESCAEALWSLGRFHHRVERDYRRAKGLWRELAERFPKSSWAPSAWSWYAKAQAGLGDTDAGAQALALIAKRDLSVSLMLRIYASYVKKHALKEHYAGVRSLIQSSLSAYADTMKARDKEAFRELLSALH